MLWTVYLLNAVVCIACCERFVAEINPSKSEIVDDHKYYEISMRPTVYNGHNVHELIYVDPDSNAHVSLGMMCTRQLISVIESLMYM